ncbi:type II secretion system F family protein [Nocardioidaceae bacterium]|nr:type II secretion system F family protein [Nocardioidaceae bacterium]
MSTAVLLVGLAGALLVWPMMLPPGGGGTPVGRRAGRGSRTATPGQVAADLPRPTGLRGGVLLVGAAVTVAVAGPWDPPGPAVGSGVVLACCVLGAVVLLRRARIDRDQQRRRTAAGVACELLVGELGAGVPPGTALRRVAADHPALLPAVGASAMAVDVPASLRDLARASRVEVWDRVADAWEVSARSGATLAPVIAQVAAGERDVAARRRLVQGELAEARATARLMAVLPWVLVGAASLGGGGAAAFLLMTWPGVACAATGTAFAFAGLGWMERIERQGMTG